jgi:hypothetical protein
MHLPTIEMDADARIGAAPRWRASLACAGAVLLMTAVPPLLAGSPALFAPLPLPWIALYLVLLGPLAFAIPAAWFLAWTPQLRAGAGTVPRRSVLLLAVLAALSAWWGVEGWSFGVQYQGIGYTRAVLAVTAGWIIVLAGLCGWAWRRPSFARSCLFHTLLFVWIGWYAFPYLGELP